MAFALEHFPTFPYPPSGMQEVAEVERYLTNLHRSTQEFFSTLPRDIKDGISSVELDDLAKTELADPDADRIVFWDDGADVYTWLVANDFLTISGTNLNVDYVDEDDMVSNSATLLPTQQSVKAYVDTQVGAVSDEQFVVMALSGDLANERVLTAGTGIGLADGGAGSTATVSLSHLGLESLTDPGADRIFFWDDGETASKWLAPDGTSLEISTTTLQVKADGINDTHIDWGTGANQVSAVDVPIADAGSYYTGTEVETALQEAMLELKVHQLTGFEDASSVALSTDSGNPPTITLTFTGTVSWWSDGVRYSDSGTDALQIADSSGIHVIYYNGATLSEQAAPSEAQMDAIIRDKAIVCIVYFNATTNASYVVASELHGAEMSGETHHWLHDNIGAKYKSGLTMSGYTLDTATDAALSFEVTDGEFYDEDLEIDIEDGSAANQYEQQLSGGDASIPVLYRNAGGEWTEQAASTLPYIVSGTTLRFMDADNSYTQTSLGNNQYMNMFLVATNDWQYPIKMIQGTDEYSQIDYVQGAVAAETVDWGTLPSAEWILLYQIILKQASGESVDGKIVDVIDYRFTGITGASATSQDHGSLSGLSDDDHTQYLLVDGTRAMSGDLDMGSNNITNAGHIGLGNNADDPDYAILYQGEVLTDTDNTPKVGAWINPVVAKTSAAFTNWAAALFFACYLDSTNTQNWTNAIGMRGVTGNITGEVGASGTITGAANFHTWSTIADAATFTNLYGLYVETPTVAGSKVTNEYGIYIADQNTGATLNYAIYTGLGDVHFGDDVDAPNLSLGTGELTAGSINRASGNLTLEIGGTAVAQIVGTEGIGVFTASPKTVLSADIGGSNINCLNASGAAYLTAQGSTVAGFNIVDSGAAGNNKWFQFRCDGGVASLNSVNDDALAFNFANIINMILDTGEVAIGGTALVGSPLSVYLSTENFEIKDAGSAAATEQDWIQVEIGGATGYIRVYAAK